MPIFPTSKSRKIPETLPRVFITMGDPAGIGPEVIAKSLSNRALKRSARFTIFSDKKIMEKAFEKAKADINALNIDIVDVSQGKNINVRPGHPREEGAKAALRAIDMAAEAVMSTRKAVMVTAPVSKKLIASVSGGFLGHTDYLRKKAGVKMTTMVMVGERLTVVPVTRHVPIKNVPSLITRGLLADTINQVIEYRRIITGKDKPIIGVSGLNPHSGEGGLTGMEEKDVIIPVIEKIKKKYPYIDGPISGDFIFYSALAKDVDIVVSMYHDQCLGPFKMLEFAGGVNLTIGLGYIRTSPDHGTAFDIAGKNMASSTSMVNAIKLAVNALNSS